MRLMSTVYRWLCERLYHELAWVYDPVSSLVSLGEWDAWRSVAENYVSGDSVLEVGFGTGRLLSRLARPGRRVVGIERSPEMVAQTAAGIGAGSSGLGTALSAPILIQGAAQQLPIPSASMTTVVSTFPAPYILDAATLSECRRVLAQASPANRGDHSASFEQMRCGPMGGLVIVGLWIEPTGHGWKARLMRLLPVLYGSPAACTRRSIADRLLEHGFQAEVFDVQVGSARVGVAVAQPISG